MKDVKFINILRGGGALIVMWSHWMTMFYVGNSTCAALGLFNAMELEQPFWLNLSLGYLNFGPLGVSIFFLITGYLASESMHRGSLSFMINRIIRVYPTYIVGLLFTLSILYFSAKTHGVAWPYNTKIVLENMSLFRLLFWAPTIDGVVWTLECQLFFWILIALLRWVLDKKWNSDKTIVLYTIMSACFIFIISQVSESLMNTHFSLYKFLTYVEINLYFSAFMMIGISLYCYKNRRWDRAQAIRVIVLQILIFAYNTRNIYFASRYSYWFNYGLAFVIFIVCMILEDKIKTPNLASKLLRRFSSISFSFYIIHGAAGYAVMAILYRYCSNAYVVLTITFFFFVIMACILNRLVERPTSKISALIERRRKSII